MPQTAKSWKVNPCDPTSAIDGQARFMAALLNRFNSKELALAAYNSGPARVARLGRVPNIRETKTYIARVLQFEKELAQ